jgi:ELWxxDGT repeat protein/cysteine-rich repeat protein
MRRRLHGALALVLVSGCAGDDTARLGGSETGDPTSGGSLPGGDESTTSTASRADTRLVGGVEKGPFVVGSSIEVAELDDDGNPTGLVFETQTNNDRGEFELTVEVGSPGLVALEGVGFHFDEVQGSLSLAPITLRALADISSAGTQQAYLNLVTHLTHRRVGALYGAGETLPDAIDQAETELRAALGIGATAFDPGVPGLAMTLLGGDTDANAYAFAVGVVLLQATVDDVGTDGPVDAAFQALANELAVELADDGTITTAQAARIAEAEANLDSDAAMAALQSRFDEIGALDPAPNLHRVLDPDGDELVDIVDNCPHTANVGQEDGDSDGIGDACECGNGIVDPGEACDDADAVPFDGCQPDCTATCERVAVVGAPSERRLDGFAAVGADLLFWDRAAGNADAALWRVSDDVAERVVSDVYYDASAIVALDDAALFGGRTTGPISLWRSDGTATGTTIVEELYDSTFEAVVLDDVLMYRGGTNLVGLELDASDGTPAGTTLLADLAPGPGHGWPRSFARIDDEVWFLTGPCSDLGQELWVSDGTTVGTTMIADVGGAGGCAPATRPPIASLGLMFFTVASGGTTDLWRSDGTAAGTSVLHTGAQQIVPGTVDGDAIFVASNGLWRSDGTVAGTTLVQSFELATTLAALGDVGLVYARQNGLFGLWSTDGTAAGTTQIALLGVTGLGPHAVVGDRLFAFLPDYFTGRRRLWVSDGSPNGTHIVQEWNPTGDNGVQAITVIDGWLYFGASDGATVDPWRCVAE